MVVFITYSVRLAGLHTRGSQRATWLLLRFPLLRHLKQRRTGKLLTGHPAQVMPDQAWGASTLMG